MNEQEKKILYEFIGVKYEPVKKTPRPKRKEEWIRRWEAWNIDQHDRLGRMLSDR